MKSTVLISFVAVTIFGILIDDIQAECLQNGAICTVDDFTAPVGDCCGFCHVKKSGPPGKGRCRSWFIGGK
ncbi:hypothetical protein Ocin01_05904 [Orchesella cincta]|uniref:Uncharacterized protein n=1 Tax=Orchesella cincta TaxID=48709 RepID=A0A1D2N663_ORCCI|nr:hypothetical protein Ocin01_05904 [Orchesella cincta]